MKLRNKKTGKILNEVRSSMTYKDNIRLYDETSDKYYSYNSLAELNAEWEDYEEQLPEVYWVIEPYGKIEQIKIDKRWSKDLYHQFKDFGNCFETKEEAEKAVEKLKAWKRLKDKGYRFSKWFTRVEGGIQINVEFCKYDGINSECRDDLDLLFGGEE